MGVIVMGTERAGGDEASGGDPLPPSLTLLPDLPDRTPIAGPGDDIVLDLPAWEAYLVEFDAHATHLLRLGVLLTGGDHHGAEDLVQETFVASFEAWRAGRVDDLGAYLRRSIANRVTSLGRRRVVADRFRARRRGDDRGGRRVEDQATDHVVLAVALAGLPPRQRAAVVLRFYEGLSVAECAEHLGVSTGTVKSQTSDALASLRRTMESSR